jgi:hypothetical protein
MSEECGAVGRGGGPARSGVEQLRFTTRCISGGIGGTTSLSRRVSAVGWTASGSLGRRQLATCAQFGVGVLLAESTLRVFT